MGEPAWVVVKVVEGGEKGGKAVKQLRRELTEQELMTQVVEASSAAECVGVAVAVPGGSVPAVMAVLRDWVCRRNSPGKVKLIFGEESMEIDKPSFPQREQQLQDFLTKQH
ncbi:hypothetical protein EV646_12173 [Kribbella antiqua]|uniref:Uncharacterized protein n=1 Tax=Kribbella antiqua TaxID=2512217 RepID=A0A4V2S1W3_9ACTN|nr:hypothetical protein [Kribbella antiqua]TCO38160.1 hypothetical protein EV646_12173 [Kribbella antiqua]